IEMQRRALELGYRPVKPGELDYVAVPGFFLPEPEILLVAEDAPPQVLSVPAEYSQSLIEWFDERIKFGVLR
ncbi:MAG TPA: hypothetical protein VNA23_08300, partial [Anaerolineales bacterium]|nr:hypothetical protein [Anaerolineales bacterium]